MEIWKEVRSELEIDHSIDSIIVGGSPPELMINARVRDATRTSVLFLTYGPYPTVEQAHAEAVNLADEHGIKVVYRVMPIASWRSRQSR